jgi:hypothetical protein
MIRDIRADRGDIMPDTAGLTCGCRRHDPLAYRAQWLAVGFGMRLGWQGGIRSLGLGARR